MKRLKISYFVDTYFPMVDGVTMVVDSYARLLSQIADVAVFCPYVKKKDYPGDHFPYRVVRCRGVSVPNFDYRLPLPDIDLNFARAVTDFSPDIVHIHSPFAVGQAGIRYAKKRGVPLIGTVHSQFDQDFMRVTKNQFVSGLLTKGIVTKVFNNCDVRWAVNENIRELSVRQYALQEPVEVCRNATDLLPVSDPERIRRELDERYAILPGEKVLLFVGRLNALKNIFFLVRSLAALREIYPSFRMLFVGSGQDEKKLTEMIETLSLTDRVTLCGAIRDRETLAAYYDRADLFVFSSLYDASSLVQIEAASQQTPTIFLRGARTAGTVTENVNGYIGENDEILFGKKIAEILADDAGRALVAANAKKDLYVTWEDVVRDVYQRYVALLPEDKKRDLPSFRT